MSEDLGPSSGNSGDLENPKQMKNAIIFHRTIMEKR